MTTAEIRVTPGQYVRIAMGAWFGTWWWLIVLPVAVCAVMSLSSMLWLIALLGLLMVMLPALMAYLYYSQALRPEAAFGTIPHTLTVGDDGSLTLTYYPDEGVRCPQCRYIAPDDIASVEDHGKMLIIILKSSKYDFLPVPVAAIGTENVIEFRKKLRK